MRALAEEMPQVGSEEPGHPLASHFQREAAEAFKPNQTPRLDKRKNTAMNPERRVTPRGEETEWPIHSQSQSQKE